MKTSMRNLLLNLAAIGLLALFLVWAETNLDGYKVQILNLIAVNAILALSLNLIYGFTGMFSLGHAGFMAIGAYVSALCVLPAAQKEMMWILEDIIWPFSVIHTPFWFSVVAGGFVAAIFGLFIAIPVLRLGGDYLGIATLGFAEIIRVLIVNLTPITNGSLGIKGIPFHASLLVNYGWLLITLYCMVKLLGSNFGNIFKAIRDDEIAAKVMGIDTFRTKVLSFCLGAYIRNDKEGIAQDIDWVYNLFPRLRERSWQKGGTLSGGEQQMLAVGRALMSRPDLVMLDEPSLGLAPLLVREIFDIILKINAEGKTVLLVEQNALAALSIAHYAYVLEVGRVVAEAPGQELLKDPKVKEAYLGG